MGVQPQTIRDVLNEVRSQGIRDKGTASVIRNGDGSYRFTADKTTIEEHGAPEEADQFVDVERGLIIFDLEGDIDE